MTTKELVKLVIKSSNNNPYKGKLSNKETILSAIETAKLGKEFADKGFKDEAMHVTSRQWQEVIDILKLKQ